MAKQIKRSEYLQLVGLQALTKRYDDLLSQVERAAEEITGAMPGSMSHVYDALHGGRDLDEALKLMGITVVDD